MGMRTSHRTGYILRKFLERQNVKIVASLAAVQLAMLLLALYKGFFSYLPVAGILLGLTIALCGTAFCFRADRYLMAIVLILLNTGFLVLQCQTGAGMSSGSFIRKLLLAIAAGFLAAFAYRRLAGYIAGDRMILLMMLLQYAICAVLLLWNAVRGSASGSARITVNGITPLEIVKVIVIVFVGPGLLCKRETEKIRIFYFEVSRELLMVLNMTVLALLFLLCGELGTLLVVYLTGLLLLFVFGRRRDWITALLIAFAAGWIGLWVLCDRILYPMLEAGQLTSLSAIAEGEGQGIAGQFCQLILRLIRRFGVACHPEKAIMGSGYQGVIGLEAIAIGGWLGIGTERYRLPLPEASNDYAFANVVQTCGLLMGFLVVLFFFLLLKRGIDVAEKCQDSYFQGVALSIVLLMTLETIIHIGYNVALLPITGIPCYFISQSFTALSTGLAMAAVLLVISTGQVRREG